MSAATPSGQQDHDLAIQLMGSHIGASNEHSPTNHDGNADPTGSAGFVHAVNGEALTGPTLAESEARFKALSEVSPLGVFATDTQGACTYTNERWQSIYGLTFDQSLSDGWAATLHPDDRAAVFAEWQRTAARGVEFDMEFRILRTDGQVRTVRSRARGNRAGPGGLTGYVGAVEDVTEQRATNARLAASEQRLRGLYEATLSAPVEL